MAFNADNKVPGVYIDEVNVPGPIAGVATSVLAVVGPARKGPINHPVRVTNPTQFRDNFGKVMNGPAYFSGHAVHGYFENGGSQCYFVRVGTAERSSLTLLDESAASNPTLIVAALEDGAGGDDIQVEVQAASIVSVVAARGSTAVAAGGAENNTAAVDDASNFAPRDRILFDEGGATPESATIATISGNNLTLEGNLSNTFAAGVSVRVADLIPATDSFRVVDSTGLETGSYLTLTQDATSEAAVVASVDTTNHIVTLDGPLSNTYTMDAADTDVSAATREFTLLVTHTSSDGPSDETFANLSMDPRHSRYVASFIAAEGSAMVSVAVADDPPNPSPPPGNLPAVLAATSLAGGANDDPSALTPGQYQAGIEALERVDEVTLLIVPDRTDLTVQSAMLAHCQKMADRFAILDPPRGADPTAIQTHRGSLNSENGFGALYYPRITVQNADRDVEGRLLVPPSGHIAGVFARTDDTKGVHKAPANEQIRGVLDLERTLTETEAGLLNEDSVNVLRKLPNRGFRVWGARNLTTSTQWRYVNVRRLLNFIEESIQEGTEFAVFEPNNPSLWQTVKRQVEEFLTTVWATGAFVGVTPEESFSVRVDEELNPPGQIALGILTFEVVLYPAPPAEFIVFRVIQTPGGPRLEEA